MEWAPPTTQDPALACRQACLRWRNTDARHPDVLAANVENEPGFVGPSRVPLLCESSFGGQPPHKGETPDPEVSVPSVQE